MFPSLEKFLFTRAHYQEYEKKRLRDLFKKRFAGMDVLDIGCGTGRYFPLLEEAGCRVVGVDRNESQVEELKNQGKQVFLPEDLPAGKKYDVILMSHVIEHMEPSVLRDFMDFYLETLKPDGKIIIITPVLGERFYYDCTHVRPYYPQSLWMLIGGLNTPIQYRSKWQMQLEDIWFFRDAFRPRTQRAYYPVNNVPYLVKIFVSCLAIVQSVLYLSSGGRIGALASWLGIYRNKNI